MGGGPEQKPIIVVPPPEPDPWYQSPIAQTMGGLSGTLVIALVGWRIAARASRKQPRRRIK